MKVYEALRRAQEERRPRTAPDVGDIEHSGEGAAAPQWMPSPDSAGHPPEAHERVGPAAEELAASRRRIALMEPDSFPTEQFRLLRSRLDSLAAESRLVTIAVTSANPGEGKSSVSINLAVVSAMSIARRVLLIDCDMRRPTIHRSFGLEPSFGLAEILLDRASPEQAILNVPGTRLDVLAVCIQPPNPSELLACARMRELLVAMSGRYDRVILDTPATLGLPDSRIVGESCDGYLMVVRAGHTPREDVEAALDVLGTRRVVGLVLNGADLGRERVAYSQSDWRDPSALAGASSASRVSWPTRVGRHRQAMV